MKCNLCKNVKIGLILALCLIVVGMVFFGVFGVNKATDNTTNYEVIVGLPFNVNGVENEVKNTAEDYFKEKGLRYYNVQEIDEGASYLYTFATSDIDVDELEAKVQAVIGNKGEVSCSISEVKPSSTTQVVSTILALGVASALIIIYLLITNKAAATFTILFNSLASTILFVSLIALTRIPVFGAIEVYSVATFILSAVVSTVIASRLREISSVAGNEKLEYSEIVAKGLKDSKFRIIALLAFTVLTAIALAVALTPHLIYTAVYVLISGITAVYGAVIGTAIFWPILKSIKKKA